VVSGKGQFVCGNKVCGEQSALKSYEVNFAYVEAGERKNALVKLRLCPADAEKLLYTRRKKDKKEKKRQRKEAKHVADKKRKHGEEGATDAAERGGEQEEEEEVSAEEQEGEDAGEPEEQASKEQINPWKFKAEVEKTKEEEFEEYFQGLFP